MNDWKALCAELSEYLALLDEPPHEVVCRAQEALAQPEPGCGYPSCVDDSPDKRCHRWLSGDCAGPDAALAAEADGPAVPEGREPASVIGEPSDEEIMGLMPQQMHDDLAAAVRAMAKQEGIDSTRAKGVMRIMLNRHVVDLARAVLARYGHQPAPLAEGEVAELVRSLHHTSDALRAYGLHGGADDCARAADLLEQRHSAPVPVSERLPGPEDCDAEGRCWWWRTDDADEWWELLCISDAREYNAGCGNARYTHWLPATALPLPQGEVE